MSALGWIVVGGLAMTAIALVGSVTLLLDERTLDRMILPLVAFAAGTLLGGAFFHMMPGAVAEMGARPVVFLWAVLGFALFFALEQFLHRHGSHRDQAAGKEPLTWLILVGDGLHNLLGGLAVGAAFILDVRLGLATWLAAAAHEVPQELGDFGILVHGGWGRKAALLLNFLSGLTFLVGGLVAWAVSTRVDVAFLVPFAAGNFVYIAASDLVPEVKTDHGAGENLLHFAAFAIGAGLLYVTALLLEV